MNKKKPTPWKVIPVSGKNEKKKTESAVDKATKVKATTKLQTEKTDHNTKIVKEEDNLDELFGSIKRTKSKQDSCLQSDQLNQSDFEMFDTRGTRKSKRRVTEEGYPIFKPEELGITTESGTTPDCPFDCSCCF